MFKEKLVELRKLHNETQEALAYRLHVSRSLVAKWEQGRSFPSINELNKICEIYEIEFEQLLSKNELKDQYGIILKKYLKEVKPLKYSKLTIDGGLMDYLLEEEKYLYEFADIVKLYLKDTYPEPKTHEFIVMAKYNNMIESMVEEFVRSEIIKII